MSKPYDAVTKRLLETRPEDWVDFLQLPKGIIKILDTDLSTVSSVADKIIRVNAQTPYLMHDELETGKDTASVPDDMEVYASQAYKKHRLPVVSTVFLLHKPSDSSALTGRLERKWPDGSVYLAFRYKVVRIWEVAPEQFLSGLLLLCGRKHLKEHRSFSCARADRA